MHVVGTAGHVDHGKSTLVHRLTGIDPDRFTEEKSRGLTIDLGFAWLTTPSGNEVGIVDVPGHERFIRNMLVGAGAITACMFVVAADEGWMPQSAEHLGILDVLEVRSAVIALTKTDLVDAAAVDRREKEIRARVGDSALRSAPIIACSARTGEGLDDLVSALDEVLAGARPPPETGRPRLWVDRAFSVSGSGTVVTGTLTGGRFDVGAGVEVSPAGKRTRIRGIQNHKRQVGSIGPDNRAALNLLGLDRSEVERGHAIVEEGRWRPTRTVDVLVRVLPTALGGGTEALTNKGSHLLYVGSAETRVRLSLVGRDRIETGGRGFARLHIQDALPLQRGDRFVLRDAGRVVSVGGGVVLDPLPSPRLRGQSLEGLLTRLVDAPPDEALAALLDAEGSVPMADAFLRTGTVQPPPGSLRLGRRLVSQREADRLTGLVRSSLDRWHDERPLETGMPRENLRQATALSSEEFDDLLARMDDLSVEGPLVRSRSFSVAFSPEQARDRAGVVHLLEEAGFTPPKADALPAESALLRSLEARGEIVRIADFYLTAAAAERARRTVRDRIERDGPLTVAQIRDLLKTTRKYAVPLCEWLDATGTTVRRGNLRLLGPVG